MTMKIGPLAQEQIDLLNAEIEKHRDAKGVQGAFARLAAIDSPYAPNDWIMGEMGRGTSVGELYAAFSCLIASQIMAVAATEKRSNLSDASRRLIRLIVDATYQAVHSIPNDAVVITHDGRELDVTIEGIVRNGYPE